MPDDMGIWIENRVKSGLYNNDSEYFRDLVRKDQIQREAEDQLRILLQEGIDSGISNKTLQDIMNDVDQRLQSNAKL